MQSEKKSLQTNSSTLQTTSISRNEIKEQIISEVQTLHNIFVLPGRTLDALHDMFVSAVEQEYDVNDEITPTYLGLRYFLKNTGELVKQIKTAQLWKS